MTILNRLLCSTAFIALAPQAFAAVTGEDVWASQVALFEATGATVTAETTRDGAVLTVGDVRLDYVLPFGAGSIAIDMGGMILTENGDGTVAIAVAPESGIVISGNIPPADGLEFSATVDFAVTDYTASASGEPGDVTILQSIGLMELTFTEITANNVPELDEVDITGYVSVSQNESSMRIQQGDVLTLTTSGTSGETITDFGFAIAEMDMLSKAVNVIESATTDSVITIPNGPINLMNLSQALRDGLAVEASTSTRGARSQSTTLMNGTVMSDQVQEVTEASQSLSLDQTGLNMEGTAGGITFSLVQADIMPFPIEAGFDSVNARFAMPLNADPAPQEVVFNLGLNGLTLSDEIWGLFDPAAVLPRDPATIAITSDGALLLTHDLLDLETLIPAIQGGEIPGELQQLTISSLLLNALGAEVSAYGAFDIDYSAMNQPGGMAMMGMPVATGEATIDLTGINGVLDKFVQLGFISQEELAMPRMMLGMFATATGDDAYTTTITIDETGMTANGIPLQ